MEDFKFALRKDAKKLARIEELLFMKEDIDRARGRKGGLEDYAEEGLPEKRKYTKRV